MRGRKKTSRKRINISKAFIAGTEQSRAGPVLSHTLLLIQI